MASQVEKILILAKTYPSPSAQHVETSCVAGINEQGAMRRLYPVPFRLIEEGQKFKKWQWIEVRVEKANKDHRAESHKLYVDTIACGDVIDTKKQWDARWPWIDKLPAFTSFDELEVDRLETGLSLALMRPKQVLSLEITEARNAEWTDDEREKATALRDAGPTFQRYRGQENDPDASEGAIRFLLPVHLRNARGRQGIQAQDRRLGGRCAVLALPPESWRRMGKAIPSQTRTGLDRKRLDVPDGQSAPVPRPVADHQSDLPA
jgi:hypothetical protein